MQKYQFPFQGDYANPFDEHSVTLVLHKNRTGNLRHFKKKNRDLIVLPVQNMLLRSQKHAHFT